MAKMPRAGGSGFGREWLFAKEALAVKITSSATLAGVLVLLSLSLFLARARSLSVRVFALAGIAFVCLCTSVCCVLLVIFRCSGDHCASRWAGLAARWLLRRGAPSE